MNGSTRTIDCAHVIGPMGPLAGGQSIRIAQTYTVDGQLTPGVTSILVVRLGRAVLWDSLYGEAFGDEAGVEAFSAQQARAAGPVIEAMCIWTDSGCG